MFSEALLKNAIQNVGFVNQWILSDVMLITQLLLSSQSIRLTNERPMHNIDPFVTSFYSRLWPCFNLSYRLLFL